MALASARYATKRQTLTGPISWDQADPDLLLNEQRSRILARRRGALAARSRLTVFHHRRRSLRPSRTTYNYCLTIFSTWSYLFPLTPTLQVQRRIHRPCISTAALILPLGGYEAYAVYLQIFQSMQRSRASRSPFRLAHVRLRIPKCKTVLQGLAATARGT
jgi:hypothetical protein